MGNDTAEELKEKFDKDSESIYQINFFWIIMKEKLKIYAKVIKL